MAQAQRATQTRPAAARGAGLPWWSFLITGALWLIIAWTVLRFTVRSVAAVAALAGAVMLLAALAELFIARNAKSWKWLHFGLAALFFITAVVTFIHPGNTFVWLSALIGWYLLFKGLADIVLSLAMRASMEGWWLVLIVGIVEVGLGFWAAGRFNRSAYLLIVFVGAIALTRAVTDIVMAFRLRNEAGEGDTPSIAATP